MRCTFCDWTNPDGSRFCNRCGTAVIPPTARAHRAEPPAAPSPDLHLTQKIGSPDDVARALVVEPPAPTAPAPAGVAAAIAPAVDATDVGLAPTVRANGDLAHELAAGHVPVAPRETSPAVVASTAVVAPAPSVDAPANHESAPRSETAGSVRPSRTSEPAPAKAATVSPKRRGAPDASTVSLAAIGVRSSRKTWALIAVAGTLLLGVGVAAGLVAGRPSTQAAVAVAADELSDLDPVATAAAAPLPTPPDGVEPPETLAAPGARTTSRRAAGGTAVRAFSDRASTDAPARAASTTSPARGAARVRVPRERAPSGDISSLPPADTSDTPTSRAPDAEFSGDAPATPAPWRSDGEGAAPAPAPSSSAGSQPGLSLEDAAGDMRGAGSEEEDEDLETTMYASRVRSVIRQYYRPRAQTCFDRASRNDPELRGTVTVRFNIGGSGQVSGARVLSNSTEHDEIGRCIVTVVNGWRLPPPPNDEPVQIEMPFSR
ncbi:MAG: TonB family protein [Deltaproteobacteria bacterium]|nr:TonB family protein [Deltaproteobacteria bacterium]